MKVKKITTIGILCALAMIVNLFAFMPLVPTVTWLTYDPKDIIIVIGGFIYGPMTSLIMSGICSVLEIMIKGGTILDVFMNMISTCSFACVAAAVYKHKHTKQGVMIGLLLGVVITVINMTIWNYIVTPIYYGMPRAAVVALLLPGIIPFNILKAGLNAGITLSVYKSVVAILRHTHFIEASGQPTSQTKSLVWVGLFITISIICIILAIQNII